MKKRIAFIAMLLTMASSSIAFASSGTITASSLRVRQNPSLSSATISSLTRNTKVETLGTVGDFYKISNKGKIGYIHSSYVKIGQTTATATATGSTSTTGGKSGVITTQYLNVRTGFGVNYSVSRVIRLGNKVTMYEKSNGFYRISYAGKIGYISELYVKAEGSTTTTTTTKTTTTTPVVASTGTGTITASRLNVRKLASASCSILGVIKLGDKVSLYGAQGEFYKIKYNGQNGFIAKSYVSLGGTTPSRGAVTTSTDSFMSYINKFLGTPYLWGGATPGGFDCSGLIQYVYKSVGVNLPRTTMDQVKVGTSVSMANLQRGDLVFFKTNAAVPNQASHAGIYVGNNKFMQSPKTGDVVKISELTGYYKERFITGKRVIN